VHCERSLAGFVHVQAACLAEPVRARLAETGRNRDDSGADIAVDDLELVALAHRSLVNVAREDQIRACSDE
jgi:hypothetical protein